MKVVAFLPAKGTSKRIESKNLKLLNGKPLFHHGLEILNKCNSIDKVFLDSESEEVFDSASYIPHEKLIRDKHLANNKTDGHSLFYNETKNVHADIYIQLLCTSPFIKPSTIEKGISILTNSSEYDSVVLIKKEKQYTWKNNAPQYNVESIPNSNDLEDTVIETMGLYITNSEVANGMKKRIGERPYLLEADPEEAIDINYLKDFYLAEKIAAGYKTQENLFFNFISKYLNSAVLSDVLDNLNINGFIRGLLPNIESKKVLGRAKTLKLKKLDKDESFTGIYQALESYNSIVDNDIIMVENEVSNYAYFGNLNANLAIKKGASATIIDGMTRDSKDVINLDFPVFSRGNVGKDVRNRATTESINKPIKIQGITIKPNDLVFADKEGVIVIPKQYEESIIQDALMTIKNEHEIMKDILNNNDINEIIDKRGLF